MEYDHLIKKYLHAELSEADQEQLDHLIATDEAFRAELEIQTVYYAERSVSLKSMLKKSPKTKPSSLPKTLVTIALLAGLLVIIGILYTIVFSDSDADQSPREYAEQALSSPHAPPTKLMNNKTLDQEWSAAIKLYEEKNYSQAAEAFLKCYKNDMNNDEAQLYTALSYLYMKPAQYQLAEQYLYSLSTSNSLFDEEARWYLALLYLTTKREQEATLVLKQIVSSQGWKHKAAELLLLDL